MNHQGGGSRDSGRDFQGENFTGIRDGSLDGGGAVQSLLLGNVTNTLNATNISVGISGRSAGNLLFNSPDGTLTVRGLSGNATSRANLNLGFNSLGSTTALVGTFDTTGHTAGTYLSNTVLLATVLFFAGTVGKFTQRHVRWSSLTFAIVLFGYALIRMLR